MEAREAKSWCVIKPEPSTKKSS